MDFFFYGGLTDSRWIWCRVHPNLYGASIACHHNWNTLAYCSSHWTELFQTTAAVWCCVGDVWVYGMCTWVGRYVHRSNFLQRNHSKGTQLWPWQQTVCTRKVQWGGRCNGDRNPPCVGGPFLKSRPCLTGLTRSILARSKPTGKYFHTCADRT